MAEQFNFEQLLEKAKAGCKDAQYSVGMSYLQGNGVQKDESIGIFLIFSAAENGQKNAIIVKDQIIKKVEAGDLYSIGLIFKAADAKQKDAISIKTEILEKAEAGDTNMQYALGVIYFDGIGVKKDGAKGGSWIYRAAAEGHKDAITIKTKMQTIIKQKSYEKLTLAGISLVLIIVLNMFIKGFGHFMVFTNTVLVGLFINNFVDPILNIFVAAKKDITGCISIAISGLLSITLAVFFIVMSIQDLRGKEIDNRFYHFLKNPEKYIAVMITANNSETPISDTASNKFFIQRNIKKTQEKHGSIKDGIFFVAILFGTYLLFRLIVVEKLFRRSRRAKVVIGFFIPLAIFFVFFTEVHPCFVYAFLGIGLSCFSFDTIEKHYKSSLKI